MKEQEQEWRGVGCRKGMGWKRGRRVEEGSRVKKGDGVEEGEEGALGQRRGAGLEEGLFCSFYDNNLVQNFHSHGREDKVNGVFLETALRMRYQVYGCHLIFSMGF